MTWDLFLNQCERVKSDYLVSIQKSIELLDEGKGRLDPFSL